MISLSKGSRGKSFPTDFIIKGLSCFKSNLREIKQAHTDTLMNAYNEYGYEVKICNFNNLKEIFEYHENLSIFSH